MTLKQKILSDNYLEDCDTPITDYQAGIIVQRADDYAIEFAEWCCSRYTKLHSVWCPIFGDQRDKNNWKTTNQLLEIFKKEKGL